MNEILTDLAANLRESLSLYQDLLRLVESENKVLRHPRPESPPRESSVRKQLLPRLEEALDQLRRHRNAWTQLTPEERQRQPEVGALLRQCQDTIMRVLLLDRENEQALLRHGFLAPRHLPSHQSQRPGYVANLYRNRGGTTFEIGQNP